MGWRTMSFMVMSSSLVPPPLSISTEGRMHTGGTGRCVMMRCSGRPAKSSSSQASSVMAEKSSSTLMGFKSSPICPHHTRIKERSFQQVLKRVPTAKHVLHVVGKRPRIADQDHHHPIRCDAQSTSQAHWAEAV